MHQIQSRTCTVAIAVLMGALPVHALAQAKPPASAALFEEPAAKPPASGARMVKVPEGTEMEIQFDEKLSSATASSGDRFVISLRENVKLADGTIIPAGYRGRGEVISAQKRGFVGKAGELNVRLDYIRVGETRLKLRASKAAEGKGSLGAAVALTVLFGPLGLLARGANIEIPRGQLMTVYADTDAELALPLPPPPPSDD